MAEQAEERLQRAMDVIVRIQRIENPATIKAFEPFLRKDAALLLAAIDGPEPGWADLREMARNAGWTPEGRLSWWTWSRRDDRGADLAAGWALVQCTARSISLVGPGTGHRGTRSAVDLIDPTPTQVLAAARLVGLVGAS